ncbi:hypothetical protein F4777DRAFT_578820 [Nemania sp. FL0916]|nr:hypothetical protein F4777DRAFT_578820 [Nemania sp. FL0916]
MAASPKIGTPSTSTPTAPSGGRKTGAAREKTRGESLEDDFMGVNAKAPCTRCKRSHDLWLDGGKKGPEPRCRVPRDPYNFNSYKCGCCIRSKVQCSFSVYRPGVPYDKHMLEKTKAREATKRKSRKRALKTAKINQRSKTPTKAMATQG